MSTDTVNNANLVGCKPVGSMTARTRTPRRSLHASGITLEHIVMRHAAVT